MGIEYIIGDKFKSSEFKIKGAIRANPNEFDKWADIYPKNKTLILYRGCPSE